MAKPSGIKIPAAAVRIINAEIVREFQKWWAKNIDLSFVEAATKFNREVVRNHANTQTPQPK